MRSGNITNFALSLRDLETIPAARGVMVSHESIHE